jgi:ribosomal protein S18 acetylase RimI-like enzyme
MTSMVIRRLGPDDAVAYQELRLLALSESPTAFGSSYDEERTRAIAETRSQLAFDDRRILLGALLANRLVGMARLDREDSVKEGHRASLRSMYVRAEHRRTGVGRALVRAQLDVADAMPGLRQVTLTVTATNQAAIAMYESCGFTSYGVAPEALCVSGEYYDEVHMVRHHRAGPRQ